MYIYEFSETHSSLDTVISFTIPDFFEIEGKDRSEFSKGGVAVSIANAAIRNIFVQNGKILIHYHPGVDPILMEEARALFKVGKQDEGNAIFKKASSKSVPGILVYDKTNLDFLGRIDFPSGTDLGGFMADKEYLYFQRRPAADVEEDFLMVYKMKLIEK